MHALTSKAGIQNQMHSEHCYFSPSVLGEIVVLLVQITTAIRTTTVAALMDFHKETLTIFITFGQQAVKVL